MTLSLLLSLCLGIYAILPLLAKIHLFIVTKFKERLTYPDPIDRHKKSLESKETASPILINPLRPQEPRSSPTETTTTMPTTTFSCAHTATTFSARSPNPHLPTGCAYPPPPSFPFPCRSCAREAARLAESSIRAEYDPKIAALREMIDRAFLWLTRDYEGLWRAIERKQEEEAQLMYWKERLLIRCWREYRERWE